MKILTPDELRDLAALETTPGPWTAHHGGAGRVSAADGRTVLGVSCDGDGSGFVACSVPDLELMAVAPSLLATALHLLQRAEKAESNYAFMVERAADQRLDGYRELGAQCARLEAERDAARAELADVEAERDAAWEALGVGPGGTLAEAITLLASGWSDRCAALTAERDAARAEISELRSLVDSYDSRLTTARVALDAAGAPDVEPYPDEPCDGYQRSLRAGGWVLPLDERVRRLAGERDALRAEVAELRAADAAQGDP